MVQATQRVRRDTAANWTAANPILSNGEIGWETNTGRGKIGDGTTLWNSLGYTLGGAGTATVLVQGAGIDPTGATDSSAAIQALINAMDPWSPGRLHFPRTPNNGFYRLDTGLTINNMSFEMTGTGATGQDSTVGYGSTRIHYTGTGQAITFTPGGPFGGPQVSGIHLTGTSSATAGIVLNHAHNWVFRDVSISGFTGASAWGFISSTGVGVNQYGVLDGVNINQCTNGGDFNANNGLKIIGGSWVAGGGAGGQAIVANTIGLRIRNGDTTRVFGTDIANFARLVDVQSGIGHELHGLRGENWATGAGTSGVRFSGTNGAMFGGSLNNSLSGNTGTAIEVTGTATGTYLRPASINLSTSTPPIIDAGTNTDLRYTSQTKIVKITRGATNITIPTTQTSFGQIDQSNAAAFDMVFTGAMVGDWIEVGCSMRVNNEAVDLQVDAQTWVSGAGVNSVGQQSSGFPLPSGGVMAWYCPASTHMFPGGSVMYQLQAGDFAADKSVTIRPLVKVASATTRIIWSGSTNPIIWWARNHGRT